MQAQWVSVELVGLRVCCTGPGMRSPACSAPPSVSRRSTAPHNSKLPNPDYAVPALHLQRRLKSGSAVRARTETNQAGSAQQRWRGLKHQLSSMFVDLVTQQSIASSPSNHKTRTTTRPASAISATPLRQSFVVLALGRSDPGERLRATAAPPGVSYKLPINLK